MQGSARVNQRSNCLTVWGGISHLNGFEILVLFYILHDCISEVQIEIRFWIAREFKIVDDEMSTIIWNSIYGHAIRNAMSE